MGIFYEYGVEYGYRRVIDGSYVTVIPLRQLNKRFLESDYYRRNRRDYDVVRTTWNRRVTEGVDIALTAAEELMVRGAIMTGAEQGGVGDVGFYSVCYGGTSH